MTTELSFKPADSNKHKRMLAKATALAMTSTQRYKHAAIVVKGGSVLSVGVNKHKNNPQIFDVDDIFNIRRSSVHAEVDAVRKAGRSNLQGAVIYVARGNRHGEQMMSKPCEDCQEFLKAKGIKKVYYTIDSEMDL